MPGTISRPSAFPSYCARGRADSGSVVMRANVSNDSDFDAVDGWERAKETFPILTAVAAKPKLAGCRAKVQCRRGKFVHIHRVAQDREIAVALGQPLGQTVPGVAAVLGAPGGRSAVRTGA